MVSDFGIEVSFVRIFEDGFMDIEFVETGSRAETSGEYIVRYDGYYRTFMRKVEDGTCPEPELQEGF